MAPKKKASVDPFAEFQTPIATPSAPQRKDPFAEFQDEAQSATAPSPKFLEYHGPGTENSPVGGFTDTYLRPMANAGRAMVRNFVDLGQGAADTVSSTIASKGGNAVAYLREQAHALAHPVEAHQREMQKHADAASAENHPYDPQTRTGVLAPGQQPKITEEDASQVAGDYMTQAALAEVTDGALKLGGKVVKGVTPVVLKERARVAARGILGADKSLTRKAVTDAAGRMEKNDAHVATTNKGLEEVRTRRREAARDLEGKTKTLNERTAAIEKSAGQANHQRWDALREKIGEDPVDLKPVKHVIEQTEAHMTPEDIKQFRQILGTQDPAQEPSVDYKDYLTKSRRLGESYESLDPRVKAHVDELAQVYHPSASLTDETKPATFSRVQGWYTELGQKLYSGGEVSGNVRKGLQEVRKALGHTAETVADGKGALDDLRAARKGHGEYQEAFGRQRSQKLSAADVERRNANPEAFAREQENARRGKVAVHDPQYLNHARAVDAAHDRLRSFPTEESLSSQVKAPKDAPVVDIHKVAKDQIEKRAGQWAQFNKRDIGIISSSIIATPILAALGERSFGVAQMAGVAAYEGGTRALASIALRPGMAEWFAKAPAGELEALARIPGADRVKIIDGLTQVGVNAAKAGKKVPVSASVAAFLGEKNVRLIAAASAARMGGTAIKSRKDALEKIQRTPEEQ